MKNGKEGWLGLIPHRSSEVILNNVFDIKERILLGGRQVAVGRPVRQAVLHWPKNLVMMEERERSEF